MGRWEPNAEDRLAAAALDLYAEQGFDATTVADIAARAGLTERTFFRHYADKREVLFGRQDVLRSIVADTIAAAPEGAAPVDAMASALAEVAGLIGGRPDHARRRHAVVAAHTGLRERELLKLSAIGAAMAAALRARGFGDPTASLVADAGIAAFRAGYDCWVTADDPGDLATAVAASLAVLRQALAR